MDQFCCNECGGKCKARASKSGTPSLPNGWKKGEEGVYCRKCWNDSFVLRSITLPVVGPVDSDWESLHTLLMDSWRQSTALANWAITELSRKDTVRMPSDTQLKPATRIYLYPEARKRFPELSSKTVVSLLHNVEKCYYKGRLAVIWRSETSLQRYRFPVPIPVSANSWNAEFESGVPVISFKLGEKRVQLRLRGGDGFRRQLAIFSKIAAGQTLKCDLAIGRQRANVGDRRKSVVDRRPGGGNRVPFRVTARMTVWVKKNADEAHRRGTLSVVTGPGYFVKATSDIREPWILHADHVRRWIARHRKVLDRMSHDRKFEKRWPKRKRCQMADYMDKQVTKQQRRLDTFCKQTVAAIAGLADRLKMQQVSLDSTDRSFAAEFPWFRFTEMLRMKLDDFNISLVLTEPPPQIIKSLAA